MTYAEKLKHPLWQKCRLRIFERDNWTCAECGDTQSELHVHHNMYVKGREPWQYPDTNFKTLCNTCHSKKHGRHFDPSKGIPASVYISVSDTITELMFWFGNTYKVESLEAQFNYLRKFKCKSPSPAPDAMIVISALNAMYLTMIKQLEADGSDQDRLKVMRDLLKLSTLLSRESGITTIIRL